MRRVKQIESARVMAAEGWMPYFLVRHQDGRLLELISYSYPSSSGEWLILVRVPGDATTLFSEQLFNLTVLHARCEWDGNMWRPSLEGNIHCYVVCPKCARRYNAVYKGDEFQNEFRAHAVLNLLPNRQGE